MSVTSVSLDQIKQLIKDGLENFDNRKLQEAERLLVQILNLEPDNWAVLFFLAGLRMQTGHVGESIALFYRCLALAGDRSEIWNNIGTAYRRENHYPQAEQALLKALELNDHDPDIFNNLGTLHVNEGTPQQGVEYLEKAIALQPDHQHAHWNLGLCLLELEDWERGFAEYTWGLTTRDRMVKDYGTAQWWDGEPHPDKTLVIYGEQGIGDEIMFASMIEDAVARFGERVILDVHPRLINLMKRAFPGLRVFPTRKVWDQPLDWMEAEGPIDYKCPMGNLGRFLRKSEADFPKKPYIKADRAKTDEYKEWLAALGPAPFIGLSWVGGTRKTRKDVRAVPLTMWKPLLDAFPDATFLSLQYTEHGESDTRALAEAGGPRIWHFPEIVESARFEKWHVGDKVFTDKELAKNEATRTKQDLIHEYPAAYDYDETAAFVQAIVEMGGVICTVNTSLVHLCGAMGAPCFILTPSKPAWRYGLTRKDMIWYPKDSVRQYRQQGDDWGPALEELTHDVEEYLCSQQRRIRQTA